MNVCTISSIYALSGVTLLLVIVLLVIIILKSTAGLTNEKLKAKITEYHHRIENISKDSGLSFALYNSNGIREKIIIKGEEKDNNITLGGMLCVNLFENPFDGTTADVIKNLKPGESISNQIDTFLNRYAYFLDGDDSNAENSEHIFKYIIRRTTEKKYSYIVVAANITDIESNEDEQEEIEKRLRTASANSNVGVASYSLDGKIMFATGSWFKNLGENSNATSNSRFVHTEGEAFTEIRNYTSSVAKDPRPGSKIPPLVTTVMITLPNGKKKWTLVNIFKSDYDAAFKEKNHPYFIDLNMDITDLKEKEFVLSELNKKAIQAEKDADDFLNSISHEIRTPLNSIIGFTDLYVNSENQKQREEFMPVIKQNNELLKTLIDNILCISSFSAGLVKVSKQEIKLNSFIEDLKEYAAERSFTIKDILQKRLYINTSFPAEEHVIATDEALLKQVMFILISNGLKFTEKGGITIGYTPNKDHSILFYVKDTGIGISKEDKERIFSPFEKVDTFKQGLGLGLTLCKSILKHLGSELQIDSEPKHGSTFSFLLK
ncbi:MAG TPA: HAMP domain-containing sensor histidine kinase [Candidatus Egerieousia sp.]|nr:HAMP domain-containing sensor histidine kinase [Candidatus Egerieousia sp.]HPT05066.1 HAMP domain-containing sensor histidine kinase [Candidatus Egerieousia sp.]